MFNVPPKPGDKPRARKAGKKRRLFASILDEKSASGAGPAVGPADGPVSDSLEALLDAVQWALTADRNTPGFVSSRSES